MTTPRARECKICLRLIWLWLKLTWWFWRRILIWLWNDCNWSLYSCGTWLGIPEISAILFSSVDNFVFLFQNAQLCKFWSLGILFPHLRYCPSPKECPDHSKFSARNSAHSPLRQPPWGCNIYFLSELLQRNKSYAAFLRSLIGSQSLHYKIYFSAGKEVKWSCCGALK